MSVLTKCECKSFRDVELELKVTRPTLRQYLSVLDVQRFTFPHDRKSYISRVDCARLEQYLNEPSNYPY